MFGLDVVAIALIVFSCVSAYFVISKLLFIRKEMNRQTSIIGRGGNKYVEILPPEVKEIPLKKLLLGIHDLEEYVASYKADWIVGIHPGGRLVSAYLADRLSFPPHRCIFAHTEPERIDRITYRGWNEPLRGGRMLVVDDITRTGMTLRAVNSDLNIGAQNGKYAFEDAHFAVMLLVDQPNRIFEPHWYRFITRNPVVTFPWSILSEQIKNELVQKGKKLAYRQDILDIHELLASDFYSALKVAKLSIESRDIFERLMREGKLYRYLKEGNTHQQAKVSA